MITPYEEQAIVRCLVFLSRRKMIQWFVKFFHESERRYYRLLMKTLGCSLATSRPEEVI
jgi:hypothetical protein